MAIVGVRKLKEQTAEIIRQVEQGEPAIVTRHGRPVAAITPLTKEDLEDWVLSHHPEVRRRIEEAEARMAAGDYATEDEIEEMLREARAELGRKS